MTHHRRKPSRDIESPAGTRSSPGAWPSRPHISADQRPARAQGRLSRVDGGWSEEKTGLLKALWSEGLSAQRIAAFLAARFRDGTTPNAVLGKRMRLALPGRPQSILRRVDGMNDRGPAAESVGLLALRPRHCRFPRGVGPDGLRRFCGKPVARGSFCEIHHAVTHLPPKREGPA